MKSFFRKVARIKKRQAIKKAIGLVAAAWAFKFGAMNSDPTPTRVDSGQYNQHLEAKYSYQKPVTVGDDKQSLIESQSVSSIRIKTGSGTILTARQNKTSEALKSALEVRISDL